MTKQYFREWRKRCGLTLEQAGAFFGEEGRDKGHVSKIETGKRPYRQGDLEAMIKAYNLPNIAVLFAPPPSKDSTDIPWKTYEVIYAGMPLKERAKTREMLKALFGE